MSTLMAQIASKVDEAAALASVSELVTSADKPVDESNPGLDHPKVEVPTGVIKSLNKEIAWQLEHGNKFKEMGHEERAKFAFSTAEFLTELLHYIEKGDELHFKLAQVTVHSAKNSIQLRVPKDVYKYLVPVTAFGKKLQEYFTQVIAKDQPFLIEGIEMLAEDVFELIQSSLELSKTRNPQDEQSEQAVRSAAHYLALLVSFMQVDKQTNTSGEEELRSYVPVGSMYRNEVQQSLDKFAQFISSRGKELDFGRFDPIRVTQQYQDFLLKGTPDQWEAVGQQLVAYYKQRESQQGNQQADAQSQQNGNDTYEMRAKAEKQGQQAPTQQASAAQTQPRA